LALAVRAHCRIFTYESIIESAGIFLNSEERPSKRAIQAEAQKPEDNEKENLKKKTLEELNELLNEALAHEDYVQAIQIRDEINTRPGKS
ncbi:MAG: UvrB/UvrC motif-containing protein, partial [Chitinophagaceae bacterium]|nr:UvrB/UvrC motif-containing protein [Chitinophagaceae bacterium]